MRRAVFLGIVFLLAIVCNNRIVAASVLSKVSIEQTHQEEDMLKVYFNALNENYEPVSDLDNVTLTLGEKRLDAALTNVSSVDESISFIFALDISTSLKSSHFVSLKAEVEAWINDMKDSDKAAIITFGEQISTLCDFTSDKGALLQNIQALEPTDNKTQLYGGIMRAMEFAKRLDDGLPPRRIIVILTDGMDDFPAGITLDEVESAVESQHTPIYAIGVKTSEKSSNALSEFGGLIRSTGGELFVCTPDTIGQQYKSIYQRIKGTYIVSTTLLQEFCDGLPRSLHLVAEKLGVRLDTRQDIRLSAISAPIVQEVQEQTEEPQIEEPKREEESEQKEEPQVIETEPETIADNIEEPQKNKIDWLFIITIVSIVIILACLGIWVYYFVKKILHKRKIDKAYEFKKPSLPTSTSMPLHENAKIDRQEKVKKPKKDDGTVCILPQTLDEKGSLDKTVSLYSNSKNQLVLTITERLSSGNKTYTMPLKYSLTIGRSPESDIVINESSVSSSHCKLINKNNTLFVKDLGSTNYTKINDTIISEDSQLKSTDTLKLGNIELSIQIHTG